MPFMLLLVNFDWKMTTRPDMLCWEKLWTHCLPFTVVLLECATLSACCYVRRPDAKRQGRGCACSFSLPLLLFTVNLASLFAMGHHRRRNQGPLGWEASGIKDSPYKSWSRSECLTRFACCQGLWLLISVVPSHSTSLLPFIHVLSKSELVCVKRLSQA